MKTQQHPRHATMPPEMEAAVRLAWQRDWYTYDGYGCLVTRYPAWECAITALWMALDDELYAACAPEELPPPLEDAIDDGTAAALRVFVRVQRDAGGTQG